MTRRIRNSRSGASSRVVLAVSACFLVAALSACSENSLAGLGGRSSDWIGEVATTATTTTTIPPQLLRAVTELEWINDEFGGPPSDATSSDVLAQVFARAGDASRFLQASRQEIVAVVPSAEFLSQVHVDVGYVTSQLVIESRELTLADDPTVAFGLWTVEPYTRSRSVGQMGVLNLSRDPGGVDLAEQGEVDAVCTTLVPPETTCGVEDLGGMQVWRIEETSTSHVWYIDPFRYELAGFAGVDEELVHEMILSTAPLAELLP
jgi:hypothetical protein